MDEEIDEYAIRLLGEQEQLPPLIDFIGCVNQETFRGCQPGTVMIVEINFVPIPKRPGDNPDRRCSEAEIVFGHNPAGYPVELPRRVFAENTILQQADFPG